jgi:alpha-ketoglutarate-dependent taurine dioxygenase
MVKVACEVGDPLRAPTGEIVKALSPVESHLARPGSLSADFGRDEFPFHTDTAFWATPARYVVMRVVGDVRRTTRLLHFDHIWSALEPRARTDALRSVWRTDEAKGGIYCSLNFSSGSTRGWRFDSKVMKPSNASAVRIFDDLSSAIRAAPEKMDVSWAATSCLIIDNWRVLHARGVAPRAELARVLFRMYVG